MNPWQIVAWIGAISTSIVIIAATINITRSLLTKTQTPKQTGLSIVKK